MQSKISNKKSLLKELNIHQGQIKTFGVKSLGLFGSFVLNQKVHAGSDIDFLVEFEPGKKTFDNFMELSFFLEEILGRKIELVTRESLSRHVGPHILKQAEHVNF